MSKVQLIAAIGNADRFRNYAQFKAYLGWYPKTVKSGTSVNKTGLAHSGVRLTRNVLSQMATLLLTPTMRPTPFREFYERLVARGMEPATAKGHLAGKLAVVIYGLLKTMKPYDEHKHRTAMGLPDPAVTIDIVQPTVEALAGCRRNRHATLPTRQG